MKTISKKTILAGLFAVSAFAPMEVGAFSSTGTLKDIFSTCTKCLETCLWRPYCPQVSKLECKYLKRSEQEILPNNVVAAQVKELQRMVKNVGSAVPSLKDAVTNIDRFLKINSHAPVCMPLSCIVCKLGGCRVKKKRKRYCK